MPYRLAFVLLALGTLAPGQQQPITRNQPLVVVQDRKYGYIDHQGNFVIKPQFYWASDFSTGFATVYVCGHLVSIDPSGKLGPYRIGLDEGLTPRPKGVRVGFADSSGQFRIPPTFDEALPFSENLAAVRVGDKWGFIDKNGRMAITPQFEQAYYFVEGVAVAELDKRSVLINRKGEVVATGFDQFLDIAEGRVLALDGHYFGFTDFNGKVMVPLIHDNANSGFEGGITALSKNGKWGYVDRWGKVKIPFQFDEAGSFHGRSLAPAKMGAKAGFIDRMGKFKFLLPYSYTAGFTDGDVAHFWTEDQRFGYVNESGKVIWGPTPENPFEERSSVSVEGHAPRPEWSAEEKIRSCEGIPASIRKRIESFPPTIE
jgi:WG containing repeat